jgi:hypothetical protein
MAVTGARSQIRHSNLIGWRQLWRAHRRAHPGLRLGWLYRVHRWISELAEAIEVQPDRRQHPNIRPLVGTGENGTGRMGDVARIQSLWVQ